MIGVSPVANPNIQRSAPFLKTEEAMFKDQKSYEEYHSRDQSSKRQQDYEDARNKVIKAAQALYEAGDHDGAAIMLFNAGIDSTTVGS